MRKIIKDKVYDTETARLQARYESGFPVSSFKYYDEALYLKKSGEYFLYGKGHAASPYAEKRYDVKAPGEKIIPLTYEEAKEWAEKRLSSDEYMDLFEVDEDSDSSSILKEIRRPTGLTMHDFAKRCGIPISTYSKWEQGRSTPPDYVVKLIKFRVDADLTEDKK